MWLLSLGLHCRWLPQVTRCIDALAQAELGLPWSEYVATKLTVGAAVTWTRFNGDIPAGTVGTIVEIVADGAQRRVEFPAGTWSFVVRELRSAS